MSPYFEAWEHETLVRFAKEAYARLKSQDEELQLLRLKVEQEREECAKVCDVPGKDVADWCARTIRARSQPQAK